MNARSESNDSPRQLSTTRGLQALPFDDSSPNARTAASCTALDTDDAPRSSVGSPDKLMTNGRSNFFMAVIVLTQLVQMMAYGSGIVSAFTIGRAIGATELQSTWIAAAYPLTQGSFVLISGRLGSVYGHKKMLSIGAAMWIFWTLATAYGQNIIGVSIMRALTGIGGGIIVPNAVALLTITFPPGRRRNLALALFAAMGPVGGAGGCIIVGLFMQWTEWTWLCFFLSLLGVFVFGGALLSVDEDKPLDPNGDIDWVGFYLGLVGLILFNFCWNQAPISGWGKPFEYVILVIALLHLAGFLIWEAKWATCPIVPIDIWTTRSFTSTMAVLFFVFMSLGIYIWYVTVFLQSIRGFNAVLLGCAWIPMAVSGVFSALIAAWAVPRMPAQVILALSCLGAATMNILLATTPRHQTYWAMIFPAMAISAWSGDMAMAAGQIIASSIVSKKNQGAAGSLIGTLFSYGLSTGLGFAGTVEVNVNRHGADPLLGYRGAAYLGAGFAGVALVLNIAFVRMRKTDSEGWQGRDAEETSW